jgi:transcriptional antiterminator RfaH
LWHRGQDIPISFGTSDAKSNLQTVRPSRALNFMESCGESHWYAVHAKPHREDCAASVISALGLDVLLPKVKKERAGHPRTIATPLFPGYLFAHFCTALCLDRVRYARGVLHIVGAKHCPSAVPDDVIASIRNRIQADGYVKLARLSVQTGDWVQIEQGPFQGLMGRIEQEDDDAKRVTILLDAIMHARVSVERRWLNALPAAA